MPVCIQRCVIISDMLVSLVRGQRRKVFGTESIGFSLKDAIDQTVNLTVVKHFGWRLDILGISTASIESRDFVAYRTSHPNQQVVFPLHRPNGSILP